MCNILEVDIPGTVMPRLQDKTVTPTEQTQTVEADDGYDGLDTVTVNSIPPEYVVPSGSVDITQNGPVNVAGKETANVNVPGIIPSGTKQVTITQNGTTTEDVSEFADAEITVNTLPAKGLVFEDYDSDGYPHSARLVGTWTEIPNGYANGVLGYADTWNKKPVGFGRHIDALIIPTGVTEIGKSAFKGSNVKHLVIPSTVKNWEIVALVITSFCKK